MNDLFLRFKNFVRLHIVPKSIAHKIVYWHCLGKKLNLKHPKDFNEKLQWLMVHMDARRMSVYADKIAVRDYIRQKGHSSILTTLYGSENRGGYNKFDEIDFDKIPEKFVLKTNHWSGEVFICTDKKKFDFERAKNVLSADLKKDYSTHSLEYHYHYIKPQIMCEEYLEQEGMVTPLDYKLFCFNGKADCIMLCSDRDTHAKYDFYDTNWNYIDYSKEEHKGRKRYEKPTNLLEMINIAEDIAKDFNFIRVDLYSINEKIYFGELTFFPFAGVWEKVTQEALDILGSKLKLPFEK